jgi:hypothetical protein
VFLATSLGTFGEGKSACFLACSWIVRTEEKAKKKKKMGQKETLNKNGGFELGTWCVVKDMEVVKNQKRRDFTER